MRTKFSDRSSTLIFIFPERTLTLLFAFYFSSNGHQGTDTEMYNERQSNQQNVLVSDSKTIVAFSIFFEILDRKNLNESKMVEHEKFLSNYVPDTMKTY